MKANNTSPEIRLALQAELPFLCRRIASMDPWITLGVDAVQLEEGIKNDFERQTLVWDEGSIAGCIGFRPTRGVEYLLKRGAGPALASAFASDHKGADSPGASSPDGGYVNLLAVYPEFHGQGHGARLLSFAEAATAQAGSDRIYLCVSSFNAPARRFYARQGYAQIGGIENCIRAGNTECLMLKLLDSTA